MRATTVLGILLAIQQLVVRRFYFEAVMARGIKATRSSAKRVHPTGHLG